MAEYAYILTGQYPGRRGGFGVFTYNGVIDVGPDETRAALLGEITAAAKRHYGIDAAMGINVLFFSLEPNRLVA